MNKTLYLKDDDGPLWDRARELSGDKLSPVIVEALRQYVAEKEKTTGGFHRIVINYADGYAAGLLKSKAFQGKWLISPEENLRMILDNRDPQQVAVAFTQKNNFAVLRYEIDLASKEATNRGRLDIFRSIEDIAENEAYGYDNLARITQERHGVVPVEELDI